jgi:hypothetical protein
VSVLARLRGRGSASSVRPIPAVEVEGIDDADQAIIERVLPYTMTGAARLEALLDATTYVVRNQIPGAFVECGVWKGGSTLAVLLRLLELGQTGRDVYLYDTFEGMTRPTVEDLSDYSPAALESWRQAERQGRRVYDGFFDPTVFDEESVRQRLIDTGYPPARLHIVRGRVEDTIPGIAPDEIAVLRLDTDWYESTRHEMAHLYPRLVTDGVLIVDDYGHWQGCRQAVEEYFAEPGRARPLLQRVDYTCRQGIKP